MHRLSLRMAPALRRCPSAGARRGVIWMATFAGVMLAGLPRSHHQAEILDDWAAPWAPVFVVSARAEGGEQGSETEVIAGERGSGDASSHKEEAERPSEQVERAQAPSWARRLPFDVKASGLAGPTEADLRPDSEASVSGAGIARDPVPEDGKGRGRDLLGQPSERNEPDGNSVTEPKGASAAVETRINGYVKPSSRITKNAHYQEEVQAEGTPEKKTCSTASIGQSC